METEQTNSKLEKSEFPVFSFRNLDSSKSVDDMSKPQLFQLKYPIEYMNYDQSLFDSDFHMEIKYSFKHNGYIYFLYTITNKILTQSCNVPNMLYSSAPNPPTPLWGHQAWEIVLLPPAADPRRRFCMGGGSMVA